MTEDDSWHGFWALTLFWSIDYWFFSFKLTKFMIIVGYTLVQPGIQFVNLMYKIWAE